MKSSPAKLFAAALFLMPAAFGHHSFAMYDMSKDVALKGTVKAFQWTNPHVVAFLMVAGKGDEPATLWRMELSSPGNLTRAGWTKRSLNPGDVVTIDCGPMRDGTKAGVIKKVTLPDGQVLTFSFAEQPGLN
jgi:Family of unknown function (DUF6152)